MLVLTRRPGEAVTIKTRDGTTIEIMLTGIKGNQARLSFKVPQSVQVLRNELMLPKQPS
jgi:carbon storage regulator CsrA